MTIQPSSQPNDQPAPNTDDDVDGTLMDGLTDEPAYPVLSTGSVSAENRRAPRGGTDRTSLFDARSFDDPPDASPTSMERAGGSSEELFGWDDAEGDYDHA